MQNLELVRLTPGRFDCEVLSDRNTKSLTIDDNNAVHVTMLNGERWLLLGIVEAVKLAKPTESDERESARSVLQQMPPKQGQAAGKR